MNNGVGHKTDEYEIKYWILLVICFERDFFSPFHECISWCHLPLYVVYPIRFIIITSQHCHSHHFPRDLVYSIWTSSLDIIPTWDGIQKLEKLFETINIPWQTNLLRCSLMIDSWDVNVNQIKMGANTEQLLLPKVNRTHIWQPVTPPLQHVFTTVKYTRQVPTWYPKLYQFSGHGDWHRYTASVLLRTSLWYAHTPAILLAYNYWVMS